MTLLPQLRALSLATGTYYIVAEGTDSSAKRTHGDAEMYSYAKESKDQKMEGFIAKLLRRKVARRMAYLEWA
jgi:hypothetical protein